MPYISSTEAQQSEMLAAIGLKSKDELFSGIPKELLCGELNLPEGVSELELTRIINTIAAENHVFSSVFRGAGAYRHYIPAIVKSVVSKEEFVTAYTPYQAEISQGVLQSVFEYQTMICELTGMDVANASVYDGASAAAEAVAMTVERNRKTVLVSASSHPDTIAVIGTYCHAAGTEMLIIPQKNGETDIDALKNMLDPSVSGIYIAYPNFNGIIEDAESIAELAHEAGAKLIMGCEPTCLSVLPSPAELGADIAVGEGQPLGMPLSFGGPYLGFMACTQALCRRLPGRIVGETEDANGNRAFVLTLQAREQHIRREKASSNICSNQALCALTAAVYLSAVGASGLYEVASQGFSKAHYLASELGKINGFDFKYNGEFFNEFVMTCPISAEKLLFELEKADILGGLPVGEREILWCATEINSKNEIDALVSKIKEVVK